MLGRGAVLRDRTNRMMAGREELFRKKSIGRIMPEEYLQKEELVIK